MRFRFLINLNVIHGSFVSRRAALSPFPYSNILQKFCAVDNSNSYDRSKFGNPSFMMLRRWQGGNSDHHENQNSDSAKEGERTFHLGLVSDIGLAAGKAITGYLTGSTAIIADAAHSASDVVLSGVALLSYRAARAPKDKEHPYGHGKFETLGTLGISGALLATAGGIGWHSLYVLMEIMSAAPEIVDQSLSNDHSHDQLEYPILALSMTTVSIAVKEGLYWITKRAGEKTGSGLMIANAWHHRADAVSSVVALVGVGGAILGVRFFDPLAGLLVAGMILKAGIKSGSQSITELVDTAVPSEDLEPYKRTISRVKRIKGYNHLWGRKAGSFMYIDVDIEVDPFSSVSAAHDVGEHVRYQLQQFHPEVAEVFLRIVPSISPTLGDYISRQSSCRKPKNLINNVALEHANLEEIISTILSNNVSKGMEIQRITHHSLHGHILLEVEVSMHPDTLVRDAVKAAEEAAKHIFKASPKIIHISTQLQLGSPLPTL
ncbi:metal tolerance protein 2-like [Andrographis paniculata]|uniref:metal tolerance protein 2-like n=1 Tax=Andrographis paniculata TaxID=175694 RepID=UPI0021E937F5|nr:metal tolerance protein 2-like [Andrographis paniculata]